MDIKKIGEGFTTNSYLVDGKVCKFFKKDPKKKIMLTEEKIRKMKDIYTRRILLPKSPIFGENFKLLGYKMDYVKDLGVEDYFKLDKNILKQENEILKKDVETCSDNKIVINDLYYNNAVYNKGIYSIDPGDFNFYDKLSKNQVYGINMDQVNMFLLFEVLKKYHFSHHSKTGIMRDSYKFSENVYHDYINSDKKNVLDFFSDMKEDHLEEFVENKIGKNK